MMRELLVYPFDGFLSALVAKDRDLYEALCHLTPDKFWRQWKRVHPEDFPQDGASPVTAQSVVHR